MKDIFSLAGRTALVTGASSGLGAHFAQVLADAGARVVACARREERLAQVVADIAGTGGEALATVMNVTERDSVDAAFAAAEQVFGTVDILVNNAGIASPAWFLDQPEQDWRTVMDTNLDGAWRVAQEASRRMVAAQRPGAIVNIASLLGLATQSRQSAYAVSKAGLVHLTHSLAAELGRHRIRVNAIAPGYFGTEMNAAFFASEKGQAYLKTLPTRRLGEARELDGALLLLCSDAGSFINGVVLPVDGGHLAAGR